MKGSDLFTKALKHEGVKHIFGIPGEENIDLLDSISNTDIEFILTRHEQGAAFMADAYARVKKIPGICLSTLGPGATNLLTGVANAHLDKVPLVAITAQAPRDRLHKESHQNVDTLALFSGVTKYNRSVIVPESIPEIVRKAFASAMKEQRGATHIQLPEDIGKAEIDEVKMIPIPDEAVYEANGEVIRKAAEEINKAKNPVILAGNGVVRFSVWESVKNLVQSKNIPIVSTFMAKGILPYEDPNNFFIVGGRPYPIKLRPLINSDLIISIGFDMVEYDPVIWNKDSSRRIINISMNQAESDEHFPVSYDLVGSIDITIGILSKFLKKRTVSKEYSEIRERRREFLESPGNGREAVAKQVMRELNNINDSNTLLISDVGLHKVWISRYYQPKYPDRTIIFNGFASMGGALPASIGAKKANNDLEVISISGDGGFMMNIQELETAKRLNMDFTAIVFNDRTLSLIEKHQEDAGLKPNYIHFGNPDFALLAKSFGCDYFSCEDGSSFKYAFNEARRASGIKVIEVVFP